MLVRAGAGPPGHGAPSGFVRADGTPKPSYEALHGLVKGEWWLAETTVRTDEAGAFGLDAYAGEYVVTVGRRSVDVRLAAGAPAVTVQLPAQ